MIMEEFSLNHGLNKLSRANGLPTKISYAVSRMMRKFNMELEVYSKERLKLALEFCDKDDKGEPISVGVGQIKMLERRKEFAEEMNKLLQVEIELDIEKVKIKLSDIPDGTLSAMDLLEVEPFVEIEEEKEDPKMIPGAVK